MQDASPQDRYLRLLEKWSRVHNLTGADTPGQRQALADDCRRLVEAAADTPGEACDVGSGAGMPGVLLALGQPRRKVSLVECEGSKAAFLEQVRIELALPNMAVFNSRIEDWRPATLPALICARGFASLSRLVSLCADLVAPGTRLLALKPRDPSDEIRQMQERHPRWEVTGCAALDGAPSRFLVDAVAKS